MAESFKSSSEGVGPAAASETDNRQKYIANLVFELGGRAVVGVVDERSNELVGGRAHRCEDIYVR